jgi:hypothetical protein
MPELLQNVNPPDFHHKLGIQHTGIGNFVRETPNSGELLIDGVPPPCIFIFLRHGVWFRDGRCLGRVRVRQQKVPHEGI